MRAERPGFLPGYGITSSDEGLLPWSWAVERLVGARNYWVTTTRVDGRPHAAPVWGMWHDDAIVFSTDPASVKGRAFAARPDVVIHLESGDEVVICEGRLERVTDRGELAAITTAYNAKYDMGGDTDAELDLDSPDYGVYRLRPQIAFAWREKDFPTSATRFRPV